jgi:MoaA/NifB/PqqE/SkfB family radical SAM enzyme
MSMFSSLSTLTLARAALLHDAPVYVQFYITARCNLTCNQCNIIYANSDVRECTLDDVKRIADNFATMGVAMVLLTGGEPFARSDLHEIIHAFECRGVHVRMQTNGLATTERIQQVIDSGGRDISISLDSLTPSRQDDINGGFEKTWDDAVRAIADFTRLLPAANSFASLGCVLQRDNLGDVEDVIRFGTAIGWFTSLVPVHVSTLDKPMGFRTFDQSKRWKESEIPVVTRLIERVRAMRREGYLLYDSDQYLDDIIRFVAEKPTTWRSRNSGVCDSPNLYFAVLPNGDFAPCCDFRLRKHSVSTFAPDFPQVYRSRLFRQQVREITSECQGCMYGSYPEMTIAMRYLAAKWDRVKLFLAKPPKKPWPLTLEEILGTAERIRNEPRVRITLEQSEAKAYR